MSKGVFDKVKLLLPAKRKSAQVDLLDLRFRAEPLGAVVKGKVLSKYNVDQALFLLLMRMGGACMLLVSPR